MTIKLGPNDRLVIRGVESSGSKRRCFKSAKAYLRRREKELKSREMREGPRWYERKVEARGRLQEVRAMLAWISKEEKRQE